MRFLQQFQSARVVAGLHAAVDLLGKLAFGFCPGLLLAPLLQALDLKFQTGILAVNVAEDFPIIERVRKQGLFLVRVGARHDRVHQVAFVLHGSQCPLEMRPRLGQQNTTRVPR